jgi:SSS family solute:Na+ symporter
VLTDSLIIVIYFAVILAIGIRAGAGQKTLETYSVGNRDVPWFAVLASILAAEISAATFLGAPGEGYAHRNFTYAQLAIGTVLARFVIAFLFLKPFYDQKVISIYEYLEYRFGPRTRDAASAIFLVTRTLASGTRLYVAAIVLVMGYEMVSGTRLSEIQQVYVYISAVLFLATLTCIYTAIGGIKAVVWTDLIQASLMFGALGFVVWKLMLELPEGWASAQAVLTGPKDLTFFDLGWDAALSVGSNVKNILESEYTLWAALIGSTFTTMATHGTDQDMVQRMLTAKNTQRSQLSLILSGLADLPLVLLFLFVGVLLWVRYQQPGKDAPFAFYIVHDLPSGCRGLVVAGIFATAMGSLSTALNSLATIYTRDWFLRKQRPNASDEESLRCAKRSTVWFSAALVIIGSLTAYAKIVLKARIIPIVLGVFGYTYGSLLGIFLLGLLTKRGSERGNIFAMAAGLVAVSLLSGLHNDIWALLHPSEKVLSPLWKPAWLPAVEFPWRIFFGASVTFFVGLSFQSAKNSNATPSAPEVTSTVN